MPKIVFWYHCYLALRSRSNFWGAAVDIRGWALPSAAKSKGESVSVAISPRCLSLCRKKRKIVVAVDQLLMLVRVCVFYLPASYLFKNSDSKCSIYFERPKASSTSWDLSHFFLVFSLWQKSVYFGPSWKFKIPLWNYNSITIIQQNLIICAHQLTIADLWLSRL